MGDIRVGEIWAYRERAFTDGWPILRVEVLQFGPPRSNKVRIRFLEGEYPGLDQWVPAVRLRVPWDEAEAWLRDEERFLRAWEASIDNYETVEYYAARTCLDAYPRPDGILIGYSQREGATARVHDLPEVCRDLGLSEDDLLSAPLAFIDRGGEYVAPWPVALRLARRVAEVYTDEIVRSVAKEESELQEGTIRGRTVAIGRDEWDVSKERCAEQLREQQPMFDLVRAWCGERAVRQFDEVAALRAELERLWNLLEESARLLHSYGHPVLARNLRKALRESLSTDQIERAD
jgi:hypothetical protein